MSYQLIAFDMDGTLLDSNKAILSSSLTAIADAVKAGKTVILSTGRCLPELREYLPQLSDVRYLNCVSGALVLDQKTNTAIYSCSLAPAVCSQILRIVQHQDVMVHLLGETTSIIQRSHCQNMAHFGMGQYQGLFERNAEQWDNLFTQYHENPFPVAKLNLYFTDPESRQRIEQQILNENIPVTMVHAEATSLEISAKGVSKAAGLRELCKHLDIPISETIAVGDAPNDLEILKAAGLSIAMGNSRQEILDLADVVVSDCDHDGCAEAIYQYLLRT